jgi:cation transport ATPase
LFGLAATGQFVVPALRPLGVLGVAIYGFPNVTAALRQLLRGQIGLPALYTFGLGLMLLSGMPFNATLFAVLMQSWPRLAQGTLSSSQRRLFAVHRQLATFAHLDLGDGSSVETDVGSLRSGDVISISAGAVVPIDGTIVEGLAAIDEETLSGVAGAVDKAPGDRVYATSYLRDGHVLVRVDTEAPGAIVREIARFLPHAGIHDLPSALEAERIANRNARPALALAVASLLSRQVVRPSQAIIRPDYITAQRLGAQLAALHDLGAALHEGVVFRRAGALDLLAATDVYAIDESDALSQRRIEIAAVFSAPGANADEIVRHAAAAFPALQNERVRALHERCAPTGGVPPIFRRRRVAGAVLYEDDRGDHFEIGSAALFAKTGLPDDLATVVGASAHEASFDPGRWPDDHLLRPLIVRRDGKVIGAIAFSRCGGFEAAETIDRLRTINSRARFIHLSSRPQTEAEALARDLGIESVGGLDATEKARLVRGLGPRTLWIGDGTRTDAGPVIGAASVSVSVAGFRAIARDKADIVFLDRSLLNLVPLRRIAREHRAHVDSDYRAIYAVNLFGVAGGIVDAFGGLQSGLISNAGTAYVYLRHRWRLRKLVERFEKRRALLTTPGRESDGRSARRLAVETKDAEQRFEPPLAGKSSPPLEQAAAI